MRVSATPSNAFRGSLAAQTIQWLQAGFSSFAYRSAHLTASRPVVVSAVALLIYMG